MTEDNIIKLFKEEKLFLITTHISPDGDGIGSVLALKRSLESLGKEAYIVNHSATPQNLCFLLKNKEEIISVEEFRSSDKGNDFVTVIADMGCFERLGSVFQLIENFSKTIIIDHHIVGNVNNALSLIDNSASATGEVVFDLLNELEIEITKDIAEPLYTAIVTDTGGFRFPGTTAKTHLVVSELLKKGVDPAYIHKNLYERESPARLKVMGEVFSTLELFCNGKIATIELRQVALKKVNAKIEDGDDLVNYLMNIEGVEAGFYFKQVASDRTKVSSRSKGKIDLDKFLSKWGGGGHTMAAGLLLNKDISSTKSIIITEASDIIDNIND